MDRLRRTAVAVVVLCLWGTALAAAAEPQPPPFPVAHGPVEPGPADPELQLGEQLEAEAKALMEAAEQQYATGRITQVEAMDMRRRALEMMRQALEIRRRQLPGGTGGGSLGGGMVIGGAMAGGAMGVGGGGMGGGGMGGAPWFLPEAGPPCVVVVPAGQIEEPQIAQLAEDLSIMSRVLEKALRQAVGEGQAPAMGSAFAPLLGGQEPQAFYLAGWGAVFATSVGFPLTGREEAQQERAVEEPQSLWDETKREMQGGPPSGGFGSNPFDWSAGAPGGAAAFGVGPPAGTVWPRYDAARVEQLKTALLEALREASHIREMAEGDSVVVIAWAAPEVGAFYNLATRTDQLAVTWTTPPWVATSRKAPVPGAFSAGARAVLTVQAKRGDIDAFAAGKLTLEEFRKRATVAIR